MLKRLDQRFWIEIATYGQTIGELRLFERLQVITQATPYILELKWIAHETSLTPGESDRLAENVARYVSSARLPTQNDLITEIAEKVMVFAEPCPKGVMPHLVSTFSKNPWNQDEYKPDYILNWVQRQIDAKSSQLPQHQPSILIIDLSLSIDAHRIMTVERERFLELILPSKIDLLILWSTGLDKIGPERVLPFANPNSAYRPSISHLVDLIAPTTQDSL